MSDTTLNEAELTFREGETGNYSCSIVDEDDDALAASDLDTLTLTLFRPGGDAINSRDEQDVLNANDVEVTDGSGGGALTWKIQSLDSVIQDTGLVAGQTELHIARFVWTWTDADGDARKGMHEVPLYVLKIEEP